MKNAAELKHSLSAIRQTRQITNAMYLLSVSEMKRCLPHVDYATQYMQLLRETKREILSFSQDFDHPFKRSYTHGGHVAFVVIASDKSMCGAYNQNIASLTLEQLAATEHPYVIMKGHCLRNILSAKGVEPDEEWEYPGNFPRIEYAADMADRLIQLYLSQDIDRVNLIYTKYLSQTVQEARCYTLLPLSQDFFHPDENSQSKGLMAFHPTEDGVFYTLTRNFIQGLVYSAMYQSYVSEQIARMTAMRSATNNADKMMTELTGKLNAQRQLSITSELIEIASASGAQQANQEGKTK